jgi:hypothetical protein
MSRWRRPFLYERFIFVTVNLLRSRMSAELHKRRCGLCIEGCACLPSRTRAYEKKRKSRGPWNAGPSYLLVCATRKERLHWGDNYESPAPESI